jgi:prophage tail gpP-like protein
MPDVEDVDLWINGQRYHAWSDVEIHLSIDTYATVGFSAPFEPERPEFRETFRPFTFRPIDVFVNHDRLFWGTMVGVDPGLDPESRTVKVSAYSLPGVLNDAHMPASAYPLEFNGLTLRQIAERICETFDLLVAFDVDDRTPFDRVALNPDQTPHAFLTDLAKQRSLVISATPGGALLFSQSVAPGSPRARLREGELPLSKISAAFSPQSYFSEVTGLGSAKAGRSGAGYTVTNPRSTGFLRPHSFSVEDADKGDVPGATHAELGRMFGSVCSYSLEVPTWRDPQGRLWYPNHTITVTAPGAMIYNETELLIRDVTLRQDADSYSATLDLVLPGAFSGEVPEVLPWEG